jgi:cysteine desulfurase
MSIYLDYNASAPIDSRVLETMVSVYTEDIGNADSRTHEYGDNARNVVETARKQVASLLKVDAGEVFFTSGATESNNIAILGLEEYADTTSKYHIITTSIEHKAVLETVKYLGNKGYEIDIVAPDETGRISADKILGKVRDDTLLVSVMHVNNESGIIQPVEEIGAELEKRGVLFHVDATQSCGKLVEELQNLKYNMLSFSAHKLRGPQGIGVLVLKKKAYKLPPVKAITFGGQQEHGIRPGTIPVALTAGCGKACELALNEYKDNEKKTESIKKEIMRILDESGIQYQINGDANSCISSAINICIDGVASEALILSTKQYCGLSNGSACTSHSYSPSYVLTAMGLPIERIENSIRVSWGPETDINLFKENFSELINVAKSMAW